MVHIREGHSVAKKELTSLAPDSYRKVSKLFWQQAYKILVIRAIKLRHTLNQSKSITFLFNSKFLPKYTFRTISSAASSSAVPDFRIFPSNIK